MPSPLISIVTPCLNSASTLEQALASVRDQGLGDAVEHVVVDGGSTDGTVDLLRQAGVRFVSEPDRGLSHAMNKGIAMARADVVGWLNADDFYLPGALAAVLDAFADGDAEWATGPCLIVDADGREIRHRVTAYKTFFLRHYRFGALVAQNFVSAPATFVRREALLREGGFDERFRYSMDYDMWLRLGRRSDPVVLDRALAAFRMAEGSLSMTGFERQFDEHAMNARERAPDHRVAVAANALISRLIVLIYRGMRALRRAPG